MLFKTINIIFCKINKSSIKLINVIIQKGSLVGKMRQITELRLEDDFDA